MIDKDDIYKELTIMENTYMTNGDAVLTIDRNYIYKQMKSIPNTDQNKADSLG